MFASIQTSRFKALFVEHALKDVAEGRWPVVLRTKTVTTTSRECEVATETRAKHDRPTAFCHVLQGVFHK